MKLVSYVQNGKERAGLLWTKKYLISGYSYLTCRSR